MEINLTLGARLLREWLDANKDTRSQRVLADTLGLKQPSVSAWLRGESRPEDHLREAIEILTGIPRDSWRRPTEQDTVERVRARTGATVAVDEPRPSHPAAA